MSIVSDEVRSHQGRALESPGPHPPMTGSAESLRRLVIADSDPRSRRELVLAMTDAGFDVVGQAVDGAQVRALAGTLRPDLVVIDVDRATGDGLSAAAAINAAHSAPVILLGSDLQQEITDVVEAGVMAVVRKPLSRANLVPAIEIALARFAEAAELRGSVAHLSGRLDTRKLVDRAKGLLMTRSGMTEPEAYRWLQRTAMDQRASMRKVAEITIEGLSATG